MEEPEHEGKGSDGNLPPPPPAGSRGERDTGSRPLQIRIKEEPTDDIKDFAETTMNELLGWYGYTDVVDHRDTADLSIAPRYRSPASSCNHHPHSHNDENDDCLPDSYVCDDHDDRDSPNIPEGCESGRESRNGEESGRESRNGEESGRLSADSRETPLAAQHRSLVSALNNCITSKVASGSSDSTSTSIVCSWCQKTGRRLFTLRTATGIKAFCSEVCFTQCRRAFFKKNKVCDWCKHVRHTVNFVDFQDGELQLQFCSEKCLNQYKMNIFCTETQEHLKQIQTQLNEDRKNASLSPCGASSSSLPPLNVSDAASASSGKKDEQILITPELWLAQNKGDKSPKREADEERESEGEVTRDLKKDERDRKREASSSSYDLIHNRDVLLGRKRTTSASSAAGAAAAAAAAHTNSFLMAKTGCGLSPNSERATERSMRDRERLRRIIRESGRDSSSYHQPHRLGSPPASSPQFSPPARPYAPVGGSPTALPPNLPPHLNGLASGLAGLGMYHPLLYSSLAGTEHPDGGPDFDARSRALHCERKHEAKRTAGGSEKEQNGDGISSTPGCAPCRSDSPIHTASSSSTSTTPVWNPPHAAAPNLHHHGVPGMSGFPVLHSTGAFPGLNPPPFIMGMPHLSCPPGFFPLDPTFMNRFMGLPNGITDQGHHSEHSGSHRQQNGNQSTSSTGPPLSVTAGCLNAGIPPVTIMVPFPIVLPIPVPIPIPLPISPEKLQEFFKQKIKSEKRDVPPPRKATSAERHSFSSRASRDSHSHRHNHLHLPNHVSTHDHAQHERQTDSVSSDASSHSSRLPLLTGAVAASPVSHDASCAIGVGNGCTSCMPCRGFPKPGRESADSIMALRKSRESSDSIMTLRRENVRSLMVSDSSSPVSALSPVKRSTTPVFSGQTLDLSKRARLDENLNSDDKAIDLSKDSRSSTPSRLSKDSAYCSNTKMGSSSLHMNGGNSNSSASSLPDGGKETRDVPTCDPDIASLTTIKVPKIHIVDARDEPPLAQPLPLPPADHAYSMRRSLILDAPSVPRASRSPSPERRYVRTVPRDMVEAAKRRCLRARVRTK